MVSVTKMENIDSFCRARSKIFGQSVLKEISSTGRSPTLSSLLPEFTPINESSLSKSLEQFFNDAYSVVFNDAKDEYYIKNLIANKLLFGRHSINTAKLFSEVRVGKSKADSVLFNGTSHIYEVKSDLDDFSRLEGQLHDYVKLAELTSLVTTKKHLKRAESLLPDKIGLYVVSSREGLSCIRKPRSNLTNLSHAAIYEFLHEEERVDILLSFFGELPNARRIDRFNMYFNRFELIPIEVCHKHMVKCAKSRKLSEAKKALLLGAPRSLKSAVLSMSLSKKESENLLTSLGRPLRFVV